MINACLKRLKAFLAPSVRKISSLMALIRVKFSDFSFFNFLHLDKSTTVSLALPPLSTTSLQSALNSFRAKSSDDFVVFNIEVSDAAILLKPRMKRQ